MRPPQVTTVLHLSDIHRTVDEPVNNAEILIALKRDFKACNDEGIPSPDIVLVSGDITQSAEVAEYEEAKILLMSILKHLSLDIDRLVLVPGNHDIHWPTCERIFRLKAKPPSKGIGDLTFPHGNEYLSADSEEVYASRLDNFRAFFKSLYGREYPASRTGHYTIHPYDGLGVLIAAFSSCDLNDNHRRAGIINAQALERATEECKTFTGVKIAAWHHDCNWQSDDSTDFLVPDSARLLSQCDFDVGLCGHTHRPAQNDAHRLEGCPFPIVAAGSLCAGARERKEAVPRSYNIIEVKRRAMRLHVRTKDTRTAPWRGVGKFKDTAQDNRYLSYKDLQYRSEAAEAANKSVAEGSGRTPTTATRVPVVPRRNDEVKAFSPFAEINAKSASRGDVVSQYVWTNVAASFDTNMPQIVLGPRGSGKTALLLSLTFEGRVASGRFTASPEAVFDRIGLMCAMKLPEITAFNGKGWIDRADRQSLFLATLFLIWAHELVNTLEKAIRWAEEAGISAPDEADVCHTLCKLWNSDGPHTFETLRLWTKQTKATIQGLLRNQDENERQLQQNQLFAKYPICGGSTSLADVSEELRKWPLFEKTRWIILFDEVEFLNEWQQTIVYLFLAQSSVEISTKIATLPYAHAHAIKNCGGQLVGGNDFSEVALSLTADLEFQAASGDGSTKDFEDVASGIWVSRLARIARLPRPLREVWPEYSYLDVLRLALKRAAPTEDDLYKRLLEQLDGGPRVRGERLLSSSPTEFGDQVWRRYQQPFRFRAASDYHKSGKEVPLYWGWRTMLRVCDGNCRWFLQLLDECWRSYWFRDGIRELTAFEQDAAVRRWADSVLRNCVSVGERGAELRRILDETAKRLQDRLYGAKFLREEALSIQTRVLLPSQAEAIAVGIAYGFVVPRFASPSPGVSNLLYPTQDVELRLGFPVAVVQRLPLRSGATVKIGDLRQVSFSWVTD